PEFSVFWNTINLFCSEIETGGVTKHSFVTPPVLRSIVTRRCSHFKRAHPQCLFRLTMPATIIQTMIESLAPLVLTDKPCGFIYRRVLSANNLRLTHFSPMAKSPWYSKSVSTRLLPGAVHTF
ncbi:hypothetical protein, partial [Lacticaseibacillus saniviri]|uniref:hypothetical protein n=1 Tax=Lacticaseibacillus saniviri TaxID=931533 RepID=UPI001F31A141